MHKLKYTVCILALAFAITNCSSSENVFNKNYEGFSFKDYNLLLAPVQNVQIKEEDNAARDIEIILSEDSLGIKLQEYLPNLFLRKSNFGNVFNLEFKKEIKTKPQLEELNGKQVSFNIPVEKIKYKENESSIVFFPSKLILSVSKDRIEKETPGTKFSLSSKSNIPISKYLDDYTFYFTFKLEYFFYDNSTGNIVNYGKSEEKIKFEQYKDIESIIAEGAIKLFDAIVKDTPFKKRLIR